MRLRGLAKIDYSEARRNQGRSTCATATDQRRAASGRVTKTVPAIPKRHPGRLPKSPSKPSPGRPHTQRVGSTSANTPIIIPKKPSRRSTRRERQHVSPIVKIVKKTATESPVSASASAPDDGRDAEHPSALMHRFFRAHGNEVANVPKKKQRKALGKLWRESPLNPKNVRAQKKSESANGAPRSETDLDKEADEAVSDATIAGTEESGGDENGTV